MRAWPRPPLRSTFPRKAPDPVPKLEPCPCGVSAGPLFHRPAGAGAHLGVLRCGACRLASTVKAAHAHHLAVNWNAAVAAELERRRGQGS